jgi:hypothetical protein
MSEEIHTQREDEAPDEPSRVARRLDTNFVIALSAVVISLCALVVSFVEVSVMRSDQRASVWPYLDVGISYSSDGFRVTAVNRGLGPALIESVRIDVDGDPVRDWNEVIERLVGPESGIDYSVYTTNTINGEVIPAERELVVFGIPGGWTPIKRQLADGLVRLDWSVCYCSVYGDCWSLSRSGERAEDVTCGSAGDSEFGS